VRRSRAILLGLLTVAVTFGPVRSAWAFSGVVRDVPFFTTSHGLTLTLDVYESGLSRYTPSIILVHGGGWSVGDKSQMGDGTAATIAASGFTVFVPNYELDLKPDRCALCIGSPSYPFAVQDIQAVQPWLLTHAARYGGIAKTGAHSRVGAVGTSAGGEIAGMVAMLTNSGGAPIRVVAEWSGPNDMLFFRDPGAISAVTRYLGCDRTTCRATWKDASALHHVTAGSVPFYMSNGELDPIVPPGDAAEMYDALTARGITAQTHTVFGSDCHARKCLDADPSIWPETLAFLHAALG